MLEFPLWENQKPVKRYTRRDGSTLATVRLFEVEGVDMLGKAIVPFHATFKWTDADGNEQRADFTNTLHTPREPHGLEVIYDILDRLTLTPEDTDSDTFDTYTTAQMSWCKSFACEVFGDWATEQYCKFMVHGPSYRA